ncbi:MAG TPA: cytosine permease, partial [Nocardioidaceae bacterium]|nr:cytosine permease [Nocardioidaceae bacterium]
TITLTMSAAFGYAAGWNPYASDYTRYLPAGASRRRTGWAAALGNFVSCTVLMAAGAAAATAVDFSKGSPTDLFTSTAIMPGWIGKLTLLAIAVGAIAANALNIYSGAMSFLAAGVRIRFALRRAIVALGFGVLGFVIALSALPNAGTAYENFLLVIAYWIGPWLGVVLTDRFLRRRTPLPVVSAMALDLRRKVVWAGPIAMAVGIAVSIYLFSNQTEYIGKLPAAHPGLGDITFLVGFAVAAVLYAVLHRFMPRERDYAEELSADRAAA